jgi:hypothetical protein
MSNVVQMGQSLTPKQSTYDIIDMLVQVFDELEVATDEERPVIEAELQRIVSMELANKVDGLAMFGKRCDAESALLDDFIEEAKHRKSYWEKRKRKTREIIHWAMSKIGVTLLKGKIHTISLRQGAKSVVVRNEALLPDELKLVTITLPASVWAKIRDHAVGFHDTEDGPEPETVEHVISAPACVVPRKTAIREALNRGEVIPGAELAQSEDILTIR